MVQIVFGRDLQETPWAQAFARRDHAAGNVVVPDERRRTIAENPLVNKKKKKKKIWRLHIRFYAGAPLAARDGRMLGAFGVDRKAATTLTLAQNGGLENFASFAANMK